MEKNNPTPNNLRNFPEKFENEEQEVEFFRNPELYKKVEDSNVFIQEAMKAAIKYSLTPTYPIGIVAVKDNKIIGEAGNGNGYHESHMDSPGHKAGCIRKFLSAEAEKEGGKKIAGGFSHDLCPGCHTDSHAEANLIRKIENKKDLEGADIYMYGHFWCCKSCWQKMNQVGVKDIYLPESSDKFKDKDGVKAWAEEVKLARK